MYLTNNLCMLWSLLEDMYINIGYRNGLPPETAAAALQSVWKKAAGEEETKKKKKKKKKKECYECKAFAAEPDIAFNINTHTDNAQLHPERFSHCCHHSMQIFISTRAEGVHIAVHWHRFYI